MRFYHILGKITNDISNVGQQKLFSKRHEMSKTGIYCKVDIKGAVIMAYVWSAMIIFGIIFGFSTGTMPEVNAAIFKSCERGVYFVIGLAGIMAVWSGLMNIAKGAGLVDLMGAKSKPLIRWVFPKLRDEEAISFIIMSMAANLFGVGNSATVFGLKAMERLEKINNGSKFASNEMCMFLAINMSAIQLVPITVLEIRSEVGAANPADVIFPALIVSVITTIVAIAVCKFYERSR